MKLLLSLLLLFSIAGCSDVNSAGVTGEMIHDLAENCREVGYISGYIDATQGIPCKYNLQEVREKSTKFLEKYKKIAGIKS